VAETKKSQGKYWGEILDSELARAARTCDGAALCNAFVETARKVVAEDPDMTINEKEALYYVLKHESESMRRLTNRDCSYVLESLIQVLGISSP
jgi:hypothetical protein